MNVVYLMAEVAMMRTAAVDVVEFVD